MPNQPTLTEEDKALIGGGPARFGDPIENGWASNDNPLRVGFFVREGRRTGRLNRGRYFEVTDGAGKFWEIPIDRDSKVTVQRSGPSAAPTPSREEIARVIDPEAWIFDARGAYVGALFAREAVEYREEGLTRAASILTLFGFRQPGDGGTT